jgi:hypothetical protein
VDIGEPWDFHSEAGDNVLVIDIPGKLASARGPVLGTCTPFRHNDRTITAVAVMPRHMGGTIAAGHAVHVIFKKDGGAISQHDLDKSGTISWLIGAIARTEAR